MCTQCVLARLLGYTLSLTMLTFSMLFLTVKLLFQLMFLRKNFTLASTNRIWYGSVKKGTVFA